MNRKGSKLVFDFEGYSVKGSGTEHNLVVKELSCFGDYGDTILFKPPYRLEQLGKRDQRQVNWVRHYIHNIPWESGDYEYDDLNLILLGLQLRYSNATFYAKGDEKCKLLEYHLKESVTNLEDLGCPSIYSIDHSRFSVACDNHFDAGGTFACRDHCAKRKAFIFRSWLHERDSLIDEGDDDNDERNPYAEIDECIGSSKLSKKLEKFNPFKIERPLINESDYSRHLSKYERKVRFAEEQNSIHVI